MLPGGISNGMSGVQPGMPAGELPVAQRAMPEQPASRQPGFVSRTTNQPLVLPPTQEELTAQAVQRMAAGPAAQTAQTMPSVQTYTTETMTVQAADAAAPTPAGGTPAAAGGAAAAQSPEELLKTLFDPLLRRLKAELRLDRERRGLITDYKR
jgi:hypothetical protein